MRRVHGECLIKTINLGFDQNYRSCIVDGVKRSQFHKKQVPFQQLSPCSRLIYTLGLALSSNWSQGLISRQSLVFLGLWLFLRFALKEVTSQKLLIIACLISLFTSRLEYNSHYCGESNYLGLLTFPNSVKYQVTKFCNSFLIDVSRPHFSLDEEVPKRSRKV